MSNRKASKIDSLQFPWKLHLLLEESETNPETQSIISWLPHGRAFKVHDKDTFSNKLMPKYFSSHKFKSFQRSLNMWGFQTLTKEINKGAIYHPSFVRGEPDRCNCMQRVKIKKGSFKAPKLEDLPPSFMSDNANASGNSTSSSTNAAAAAAPAAAPAAASNTNSAVVPSSLSASGLPTSETGVAAAASAESTRMSLAALASSALLPPTWSSQVAASTVPTFPYNATLESLGLDQQIAYSAEDSLLAAAIAKELLGNSFNDPYHGAQDSTSSRNLQQLFLQNQLMAQSCLLQQQARELQSSMAVTSLIAALSLSATTGHPSYYPAAILGRSHQAVTKSSERQDGD